MNWIGIFNLPKNKNKRIMRPLVNPRTAIVFKPTFFVFEILAVPTTTPPGVMGDV